MKKVSSKSLNFKALWAISSGCCGGPQNFETISSSYYIEMQCFAVTFCLSHLWLCLHIISVIDISVQIKAFLKKKRSAIPDKLCLLLYSVNHLYRAFHSQGIFIFQSILLAVGQKSFYTDCSLCVSQFYFSHIWQLSTKCPASMFI